MRQISFIFLSVLISVMMIFTGTGSAGTEKEVEAQPQWSKAENIAKSTDNAWKVRIAGDLTGRAHVAFFEGRTPKYTSNSTGSWITPKNCGGSITYSDEARIGINVDYNNIPIVILAGRQAPYWQIFVNRYVNNSFEGIENVSKTNAGSTYPTMVVDKATNDYFVFWQDDIDAPEGNESRWDIFMRYKNGGEGGWIGAGSLPDPNNRAYSPWAAINDSGTIYVVYANRAAANQTRVFFTVNDTPKTNDNWKNSMQVSNLTGYQFADPRVACDNFGNVHVVWNQMVNGIPEVFYSRREGNDWKAIENVSQTGGPSSGELLAASIAVNKESGTVYVVYHQNLNPWRIMFKTLTHEKNKWKWSAAENITTEHRGNWPWVAVDGLGNIHVAYTSNAAGAWDVWYKTREGDPIGSPEPPQNPSVVSTLDETTPSPTKTNTFSWEQHPNNAFRDIQEYRIFRKESKKGDNTYKKIKTVEGSARSYDDTKLSRDIKYTYRVTAFDASDLESDPSDSAAESSAYAPINLSVKTRLDETGVQKINSLAWEGNKKNKTGVVANYNIYRWQVVLTGDESVQLIGTVGGDVFAYEDIDLSTGFKYGYRITAVDSDKKETEWSESDTEALAYPPHSLSLDVKLEGTGDKKTNSVLWALDPRNTAGRVKNYQIYRRDAKNSSSAAEVIATAGPDETGYKDESLDVKDKYSYFLSSIDQDDKESEESATVSESLAYAPVNLTLTSALDSSGTKKANALIWEHSPHTDDTVLKNYKIYRRIDTDPKPVLLATVTKNVTTYNDGNLATTEKYVYSIKATDKFMEMSESSLEVKEKQVFAPIQISLETKENKLLFHREKINYLRWAYNPLNDARTITYYKVYRKKTTDPDSAFEMIERLNANEFEFTDRGLTFEYGYAYAVTCLDEAENESLYSLIVEEE